MPSDAMKFLMEREEAADNMHDRHLMRRMISQWDSKEKEAASFADRPLKIFLQNCDQYYLVTERMKYEYE